MQNLSILEETDLSSLVENYNIRNSTVVILRLNKKKLGIFLKSNLSGVKKNKKIDFKLDNLEDETVRGDIISNIKLIEDNTKTSLKPIYNIPLNQSYVRNLIY